MSLTCPKCHGEMRQYERSGVTIDQCGECRGIFLDRGELEKLFEAEANWSRQQGAAPAQPTHQQGGYPGQPSHQQGGYPPPPPPPPAPAPHQPGYGAVPPPPPPVHGYPPAPAYGQQHHGYHGHYKRKKHKSFLDEMFG
ncbi:zf-TFIIB domain-containing protein [Micromonospora sp. WMMD737]|uniref:TFIIB-type zinc ribbon-containing protein n=1 Tax=Micromonospora sp. WMMD737 TaxID=3404113 RepID=UPI003B9536F4